MVAEEVIITLSGGAPWGFRLQGGVEQQKPLQVAKVRQVNSRLDGSSHLIDCWTVGSRKLCQIQQPC